MNGQQPPQCLPTTGPATACRLSDGELLERFVSRRDEEAFAALMSRHGPMVFGVCRRLLRQPQDAEDAFQATFLVLARKASSIGRRELVANWLYGVAHRVAARARAGAAKHQARPVPDVADERTAGTAADPLDLQAVHEEVERLPPRYRGPVVLCYLQGRSNEEAAAELRWPVGTVKGRLARARDLLRKWLTRRGLAPSVVALSAALSAETLAAPPAGLVASSVRAAAGGAAADGLVSAHVIALAKGVVRSMFLVRLKVTAAFVVALLVLVGGAGGLAYRVRSAEPEKKAEPTTIQGDWKITSAKLNGNDPGADEAEAMKRATFEFTADKILTHMGDGSTRESTYKADPSAKPARIDVTTEKEGEFTGIYKLDGDTLTLCLAMPIPGAARPTEFESKEGENTMLIVLQRVKK